MPPRETIIERRQRQENQSDDSMLDLSLKTAWALSFAEEEKMSTIHTVTAAAKDKTVPTQVDSFEQLMNYVNLLEEENRNLRKQLDEANGDIPSHEVRDAATAIVNWLNTEFPDKTEREEYVRSYMDSGYIREARRTSGSGHAKAIAMAANMILSPVENTNE